MPAHLQEPEFEGSGIASDPYLIFTVEDLANLAKFVNAGTAPFADANVHFRLENHLDLDVTPFNTGVGWIPIGTAANSFIGIFDGNDKTIANMLINRTGSNVGLFGVLGGGAQIRNLGVVNASVNATGVAGSENIAVLVGHAEGTAGNRVLIDNCFTTGTLTSASTSATGRIGGLVGHLWIESTLTNSWSTVTIEAAGASSVAGLVGRTSSTTTMQNNVALNPSVRATGANVRRVFAVRQDNATYDNLYAWHGMGTDGGVNFASGDATIAGRNGADFPVITQPDTAFVVGQTLTLSVVIPQAIAPFATYQWQRNGADIAGANLATFTKAAAFADSGNYVCVITVADIAGIHGTFGTYATAVRRVDVVPPSHEITFNTPDNGELIVMNDQTSVNSGALIFEGTELTITATPETGYLLETLKVNGNDFTSGEIHTVTGATEIIATFIIKKYEVTFNTPNYGTLTVMNDQTPVNTGDSVTHGTILTITATPASYHHIRALTINDVAFSGGTHEVVSEIAINAVFAIDTFAVIFNNPYNGTLSVMIGSTPLNSGDFVPHGTVLTITATPNTSYAIETLTVNGGDFESGKQHTVIETTVIAGAFMFVPFFGEGTELEPYLITSAEQLALLAEYVNAGTSPYADAGIHFRLENNIDLDVAPWNTGQGWIPIGNLSTTTIVFRGIFDGNNKIVSNLYINRTGNALGLFGRIDHADAVVRNLGVVDVDIRTTNGQVGGLAGRIQNGTVTHSFTTGTIIHNTNDSITTGVGGIVGYVQNGTVSNSWSAVSIEGSVNTALGGTPNVRFGGIVGWAGGGSGRVTNCVALGSSIKGNAGSVGRIAANFAAGTIISNSAWAGMGTDGGIAFAAGIGLNERNGADLTTEQIHADGTLGDLFTTANGWAIENGKLPGFGAPIEMPNHLQIAKEDDEFDGEGTSTDPYQIKTVEDLAKLAELVNSGSSRYSTAHFRLMNNLDLDVAPWNTGQGWIPIGNFNTGNVLTSTFRGVFDGNGKTVSNLHIERGGSNIGLFGRINGGHVRNLGVVDASIHTTDTAGRFIGVLAGHAIGTESNIAIVENSYTTGIIISASRHSNADIGGAIGHTAGRTIVQNSWSAVAVDATDAHRIGGMVGRANGADAAADTLRHLVALNPSLKGAGTVRRVYGSTGGCFRSDLYAWTGMHPDGGDGFNINATNAVHDNTNGANFPVIEANATTLEVDETLTLSVFTPPAIAAFVTYQWQFNGVNIEGATSDTLSKIVATTDEGDYICVITVSDTAGIHGIFGAFASAAMSVTVTTPPVIKYSVTLVAYPSSNAGTLTGDSEYAKGDTVTITATPAEGWKFVRLEVEKGEITLSTPTESSITFIMPDEELVIKAVFEEIEGTGILITETTTPITVWISNGILHINGLQHGEQYWIYTVSGTLIYHGIATSDIVGVENFQPSTSGIYILRTRTHSVKFVW
jgi:hypothetical protein